MFLSLSFFRPGFRIGFTQGDFSRSFVSWRTRLPFSQWNEFLATPNYFECDINKPHKFTVIQDCGWILLAKKGKRLLDAKLELLSYDTFMYLLTGFPKQPYWYILHYLNVFENFLQQFQHQYLSDKRAKTINFEKSNLRSYTATLTTCAGNIQIDFDCLAVILE